MNNSDCYSSESDRPTIPAIAAFPKRSEKKDINETSFTVLFSRKEGWLEVISYATNVVYSKCSPAHPAMYGKYVFTEELLTSWLEKSNSCYINMFECNRVVP